MSSAFWKEEAHSRILKNCLSNVVKEINQNPETSSILLLVAKIPGNKSLCMEIYNGETFASNFRCSGLPQKRNQLRVENRNSDEMSTSNDTSILPFEEMPLLKQGVTDLVELLDNHHGAIERIYARLQKLPRQQWLRLSSMFANKANQLYILDQKKQRWGFSLEVDPAGIRHDPFEAYVQWLISGQGGRAPSLKWHGGWTLTHL